MRDIKQFSSFLEAVVGSADAAPPQVSDNQKVELTKAEEFELSKKSHLPVKMKVGMYDFRASIHAQARAAQRRSSMSPIDWKDLDRKIAHYVEDNKIRRGTYMFHDSATGESIVCGVKDRLIEIVTVYPKGTGGRVSHKQTAAGVKSAIMEGLYESVEMEAWLDEALALTGRELDDVIVL